MKTVPEASVGRQYRKTIQEDNTGKQYRLSVRKTIWDGIPALLQKECVKDGKCGASGSAMMQYQACHAGSVVL
jgi:hypothetical protein